VRKRTLAAGIGILALAAPGVSFADPGPSPGDLAAVDVYRESLPTSGGSVVIDPGPERLAPLPKRVEERLERAGERGAVLERVARSSAFGAPQRRLPPRRDRRTPASAPDLEAGHRNTVAATADVLGETRLVVLAAVLGALTIAAVGLRLAAWSRRRSEGAATTKAGKQIRSHDGDLILTGGPDGPR
jgi:hypothetical protein